MADNYVQIGIRATDEGAKADMDALRARLDELKAERASIEVDVNDKDGVARLTKLDSQIEALSAKVAKPKVTLAGAARAEADLAALDLSMDKLKAKLAETAAATAAETAVIAGEMDKLKAKADEAGGQGVITRVLAGSGGGGGMSGLLEKIPLLGSRLSKVTDGLGSLAGGGEEAGEAVGSLAVDLPVAAAAALGLSVAVGGLLAELDALVVGVAAAGAGIGAFALLAAPTFKKVIGAVGDTKAQLAKLPEPIQAAVHGIDGLKSSYEKMAKSFQGDALKVLNQGLGIASKLLPYVGQFAHAAAPAVEKLLGSFSKGLDSSTFKNLMHYLEQLSGPVITAVGSGMKGIGKDLAHLFTIMSKKDVINGINIGFRLLGFALSTVTALIEFAMHRWDRLTSNLHSIAHTFDTVRHAIASAGHGIAHAFDVSRHAVASWAHNLAHYFDTVRHTVASWGHTIAHDFDTVRHTVASWGHAVAHDFDTVRHTVASWGHDVAHTFDAVRHDIASWGHAIASTFDTVRHTVASWMHDVAHDFDAVRHDAATLGHNIAATFDNIRHTIAAWANDVGRFIGRAVAWFRGLPGRIRSAVGNLGSLLYQAGVNVIDGLIRGIESRVGGIISTMGHIAGLIRAHLPFSPAKMGPLSGSGSPELAGRKIASMLAEGISSGRGGVAGSMSHLASAVSAGVRFTGSGHGAYGAGGVQRIQLELTGGNDAMAKALRQMIRVKGGNVQRVLGTASA